LRRGRKRGPRASGRTRRSGGEGKAIIEPVFGPIKGSLGYDYFLCRGFGKVTTEVHLTALTYNLKRVCHLVGGKKPVEAVS
jgi:hypothetical protein